MAIVFGPEKEIKNLDKHKMSLAEAEGMDLDGALIAEDTRVDYGETRMIAIGQVGDDVRVLVYVERDGDIRAISLRPANRKEIERWKSTK